jgi:hypothetical protein
MMRRLTFSLDAWQGHNPSADILRANAPGHATSVGPPQCYTTNIPAALLSEQDDLLEQLMGFAHALGAQRLEVFVRDAE